MQILSEQNQIQLPFLGGKNPGKNLTPVTFFMNTYSPELYNEILKFYNYAPRNQTFNGDVILRKMESTKSSKKCWSDQQGDENHV